MDYTQVQDYFDKYIMSFPPFKDKKAFQGLMTIVRNNYIPAIYDEIPKDLKDFVENQKINSNLYDRLLLGIGYPSKLISNLRFTQKQIIIQNLMDYHQYVGTPKYVSKVCQAFKENFNIYELFIDRRPVVNSINSIEREWVVVGNPLFESDSTVTFPLTDYDEIYNATPTQFLSKTALEILRLNKSITLPVKSNLIFLNMKADTDANELTTLTSVTALYYFKDLFLDVYIDGQTFTITLAGLYQIWYYIVFKYLNKVHSANLSNSSNLIYFNISTSAFPYTLDINSPNNIQLIIEEYNSLPIDQDMISKFYKKYFSGEFYSPITTASYNLDDFRKRVITSVGSLIVNLIDSLLSNSDNLMFSTIELLGSLDDSLKTYVYTSNDTLLQEFASYLYNMFPPLLIDPEQTATYQLLTYFKPAHCQLIAQAKYSVTSNSKLNNAAVKDTSQHVIHDYVETALVLSDDFYLSKSIETGYYEFTNTDTILTDLEGASSFALGDLIYSRNIYSNEFPRSKSVSIVNIFEDNGVYKIKLQFPYTGPIGIFPRAYKLFPPTIDELIDLTDEDGYFTFTTIGQANIVHTTEFGILKFNIGDYIYSIVDSKDFAVEIISKDFNTNSFILRKSYSGTSGSWPQAYRWRPIS